LFAPEHAGDALLEDAEVFVVELADGFAQGGEILVHFIDAGGEGLVEVAVEQFGGSFFLGGEAETQDDLAAGGDGEFIPGGAFGADGVGADGVEAFVDEAFVKGVFYIGGVLFNVVEAAGVGFVFGEEPFERGLAVGGFGGEDEGLEFGVFASDAVGAGGGEAGLEGAAFVLAAPDPGVAKPESGQHVEGGGVRAAIGEGEADEGVVGAGFGVFGEDVEVAVFVKDAGVGEFKFAVGLGAGVVFGDKTVVGEGVLGVFIEGAAIGVGGRGVEVVIEFLDVFAVVAFGVGEAEEAFLEDGVLFVPEGEAEAEAALAVGPAEEAVLAPAVGAGAGVVVGKVFPAGAVGGVVFADGGPLAFGEVGSPAFPVFFAVGVFGEAGTFGGAGDFVEGGGAAARGGDIAGETGADFGEARVARERAQGSAVFAGGWQGDAVDVVGVFRGGRRG